MKTNMACLILASGLSRRFGGDDKLLAELKGQALLAYALDTAKSAPFADYFVITPKNDPRAELARVRGFKVIDNSLPDAGQGASLALGASHIVRADYEAVCVLLGDMPFITPGYLARLIRTSSASDIIFSQNSGLDMPPAIFRGDALLALQNLTGDQGAKHIDLSRFSISRATLPDDMARDMDRPEDFDR